MMKKFLFLCILNTTSISLDNNQIDNNKKNCNIEHWSPAVGFLMLITTTILGINQGIGGFNGIKKLMGSEKKEEQKK